MIALRSFCPTFCSICQKCLWSFSITVFLCSPHSSPRPASKTTFDLCHIYLSICSPVHYFPCFMATVQKLPFLSSALPRAPEPPACVFSLLCTVIIPSSASYHRSTTQENVLVHPEAAQTRCVTFPGVSMFFVSTSFNTFESALV